MDFYKRALALREETISHRRWLHSNAEVGLHMPKGQCLDTFPISLIKH